MHWSEAERERIFTGTALPAPPMFCQAFPVHSFDLAVLVLYFELCVGRLLGIQAFSNGLIHTLRGASTMM